MRSSTDVGTAIVLALSVLGSMAQAQTVPASMPAANLPVICPAIEQDGRPRTNIGESNLPIGLVVLGKAKTIKEPAERDGVFEVQVERVLYGSLPNKTLRFSNPWSVQENISLVFALVPNPYEHSFELKYTIDGAELKSQVALSAARLDFHVLSSSCIFVGRELSVRGDYLHDVEVVQALYGPALNKGQTVTVEIGGYVCRVDETPRIRDEEMIFFVSGTTSGKELYDARPEEKKEEAIYQVVTRLPADLVGAVREALNRRSEYPVVEVGSGKDKTKVREVLFAGSTSEAVEMMGSASEAAVTLAARTLLSRREHARKVVLADLEKELLNTTTNAPAVCRRVRNLISWLKAIGEGKRGGEVGRLVERYLEFLADAPAATAAPKRGRASYWSSEEEATDANHVLAWLLASMDEMDVIHSYSRKLLELRGKLEGDWKDEIQLALDAARVEDNLELLAALEKSKGIKPMTICPVVPAASAAEQPHRATSLEPVLGHAAKIKWAHFSSDGKLLRTIGDDNAACLWDAETLAFRRRSLLPASTVAVSVRPPDGQYVLCASARHLETPFRSGIAGVPEAKVVDADDGKTISEVDLPVNWTFVATKVLWLSNSHALCIGDGVRRRFDYLTGKMIDVSPIGSAESALYNGHGYAAEDGVTVFCIGGGGKSASLSVDTLNLDTGRLTRVGESQLPRFTGNSCGLVPGGKYFYFGDPGMYLFDRTSLELVAQKTFKGYDLLGLTFSADGGRYAAAVGNRIFIDENGAHDPETRSLIRVHDTLTNKTLSAVWAPRRWIRQLQFAPGGRRLAAVTDDGRVTVWNLND